MNYELTERHSTPKMTSSPASNLRRDAGRCCLSLREPHGGAHCGLVVVRPVQRLPTRCSVRSPQGGQGRLGRGRGGSATYARAMQSVYTAVFSTYM
jgi:hypothetical protein